MENNGVNQKLRIKRVGEINYNIQGQRMEIVQYINDTNISVKFESGHIRDNCFYNCFKNGTLKNYDIADVYGVGISGYKKKKNKWENG